MTAFITGINGQDGSYLTEMLLEKGYKVYGIVRRTSLDNLSRLSSVIDKITLMSGDISIYLSLYECISEVMKNEGRIEIYNLGAQTNVKYSFDDPLSTYNTNLNSILYILEIVSKLDTQKRVRIYNACTSEMYGDKEKVPQNEDTEFSPCSPYAISKYLGYVASQNYRKNYNIFISNGILFNHESKRRGENFVTRKITLALKDIKKGNILKIGNLNSRRDWGHASDYVKGMWMMLQRDTPEDFVLATGKQYTIRQFIERAFYYSGINVTWKGEGLNEVGIDGNGKIIVEVDEKFFRPNEVSNLLGDSTKAKNILGWEPEITFDDLVLEMVTNDFLS
jgi:GDPmannose 4,6-dehydratase